MRFLWREHTRCPNRHRQILRASGFHIDGSRVTDRKCLYSGGCPYVYEPALAEEYYQRPRPWTDGRHLPTARLDDAAVFLFTSLSVNITGDLPTAQAKPIGAVQSDWPSSSHSHSLHINCGKTRRPQMLSPSPRRPGTFKYSKRTREYPRCYSRTTLGLHRAARQPPSEESARSSQPGRQAEQHLHPFLGYDDEPFYHYHPRSAQLDRHRRTHPPVHIVTTPGQQCSGSPAAATAISCMTPLGKWSS